MSSRFRPREEPGLFDDLPLQQEPPRRGDPAAAQQPADPSVPKSPPAPVPEPLPLFSEDAEAAAVEPVTRPAWWPTVQFAAHLEAGLIDLGVILGVMLAVWVGLWWLGVDVDLVDRALVLFFLLPFSFLYQIFPLVFWGCTPGMAKAGIVARSRDGQTLSFSQAALRWAASVLTVVTAGLPLILAAKTGRSLADRLSGSRSQPAK